jgi:hypothetical protein
VTLFRLVPKPDSPIPKGLRLDSSLDIVTNVSVITVPVLCYDGKILKVSYQLQKVNYRHTWTRSSFCQKPEIIAKKILEFGFIIDW